jgi:hypothetical protein
VASVNWSWRSIWSTTGAACGHKASSSSFQSPIGRAPILVSGARQAPEHRKPQLVAGASPVCATWRRKVEASVMYRF